MLELVKFWIKSHIPKKMQDTRVFVLFVFSPKYWNILSCLTDFQLGDWNSKRNYKMNLRGWEIITLPQTQNDVYLSDIWTIFYFSLKPLVFIPKGHKQNNKKVGKHPN